MSNLYVEKIDSLNTTFVNVITSAFTSLPLFIPVPTPPVIRNCRLSISGDSTSIISEVIIYWRPEKLDVNINQYTPPTALVNLGDVVGAVDITNVSVQPTSV